MKDNLGLVEFCKQALNSKTGYVYGTFGQLCTAVLLDQKARQYPAPNLAGGPMRTVGDKWIGCRVTDCIGLIKYYLMSDRYGRNPVYIQKYDTLNANALFHAAKESGPISTLPEIPGLLLHMDGHVGVYIGGGYAIEARGTVYGVVKTKVAGRGWDHWYKCIWLDYAENKAPAVTCDTTMDMVRPCGAAYQFKVTSGKNPKVNVGSGGVATILPRYQSGKEHFYYIVGYGKSGAETGVYVNDVLQFKFKVK